jgi:hypothetical protein
VQRLPISAPYHLKVMSARIGAGAR